jgi:hypothetical protein
MKEDGCGRIGDEGENLDEDERIFCFEGDFEIPHFVDGLSIFIISLKVFGM